MALDYEDYEDWGEQKARPGRSPRKQSGGWGGNSEAKEEKSTPESRIQAKLASFEPKKGASPQRIEELARAKEDYLQWVNRVLSAEDIFENIMEEQDLEITERNSGQLVNVRHKPSGYYTHGMGESAKETKVAFAKDELFKLLDRHITDWQKVPAGFRIDYGIVPVPALKEQVTQRSGKP